MPSAELPTGITISFSQQHRRCGKADCPACKAHGAGHGPYWYAYWWDAGRMHSRYLGKQLPATVAERPPSSRQALEQDDTAGKRALRVRTLGGFAVWRGETLIAPTLWHRRKVAALFTCLLGAPRHSMLREQLAEHLWPDAEPGAAAKALRSTLHLLRQALDTPDVPESYLRSVGDLLSLIPNPTSGVAADWCDALTFAHAADIALAGQDTALCQAALALYGGDYLPEDPYDEWTFATRESLRAQYHAVLLQLATVSIRSGNAEEALRCLRTLLVADPSHEAAARLLMSTLARSGRRHEALQVYQMLTRVLQEDLGLAPSAETRTLHARVLAQTRTPIPTRHSNLPAALTSFIGRDWERAEVDQRLRGAPGGGRLLTLTGVGGCGKTRLALEVAAGLLDEYPDGVTLVELAALVDPLLVPQAVATALGLRGTPERPLLATLTASLESTHLLLLLDNCEHLLEPCAVVAQTLLQACPALRILATSREALGVLGETIWRVPSLSVADPRQMPLRADLASYEAVQLFVERARASQPAFSVTARNAALVAMICWQLDGIPLAIELAAAQLARLSIDSLAARLHDRFRLLTSGNRTALPRQQTLQAAIDWSYELLTRSERALLQRLAVFVGGWVHDGAVAVGAGDGVAASAVQSALTRLVATSLVVLERPASDGETRYRLLETIRYYGRERLEEDDLAQTSIRHLLHFRCLAESAEPELTGPSQAAWLQRLMVEHDNLRAALRFGLASADDRFVESAARLAGDLWRFWSLGGYVDEGRRWLADVLRHPATLPAAVRAQALYGAGALAFNQADFAQADILAAQSLAIWQDLEDLPGIAACLIGLGNAAWAVGECARATTMYERSLALWRDLGDIARVALCIDNLGAVATVEERYPLAMRRHEESLALRRQIGDTHGTALTLYNMSAVAAAQHNYASAAALLRQAVPLWQEVGARRDLAGTLASFGTFAKEEGHAGRAAQLFAAGERLREITGEGIRDDDEAEMARGIDAVRASLGAADFATAWAAGQAMDLEQALAYALEDSPNVAPPVVENAPGRPLKSRGCSPYATD